MIRAIVDANILISHLLHPTARRPPNRIIEAGIAGEYHLILVQMTLNETEASIRAKPYLANRIDAMSLAKLQSSLHLTATVIPAFIDRVPSLTRDPGDDYLLAHGIILHVDYLVTGDKDLLVLGEFERVRILSPAEFVAMLER